MPIRSVPLSFQSAADNTLSGTLVAPAGPVRATALFAHCFTCDSRSHAAARISTELAKRGIAVLRFDFTGLGTSEGDFAATTFTSNLDDLRSAAMALRAQLGGPQLLVGHSLGGAAVLAVANTIDGVRGVVTIGAPADPDHVLHLLPDVSPDDARTITADIGGRPFEIGTDLIRDLRNQTPAACIANLGAALLVMHSPIDRIVGIDNAREIYDRARHPKSFITLDGADHLLTNRADAVYVAEITSAWASRYVTDAAEPAPRS